MNRLKLMVAGAMLLVAGSQAMAHFVFVVPEKGDAAAKVIMSEDLDVDKDVKATTVSGTKLTLRDADGKDAEIALGKAQENFYELALTGSGQRIVYGTLPLGVRQRGDSKPYRFTYFPKTIIGDAFDPKATVGEKAPVELVPIGKPGAVKFKLLVDGKPSAKNDVTVILPGTEGAKKVVTDENGETPVFTETGRYGAWARTVVPQGGELDGKKYDEFRRYPTLVVDVGSAK